MPTFELTSPWGQKYRVNAPEGATQDQAYDMLKQHLSQTQDNPIGQAAAVERDRSQPGLAGTLARGLTGFAQGVGELTAEGGKMVGLKPGQAFETQEKTPVSPMEQGARAVGRAAIPVPGGPIAQGVAGGVTGALQPADSWTKRAENAAIGAGSASGLGLLARQLSPHELAHLAGLALGFPHGGFGGAYLGGAIGRTRAASQLGQLAQFFASHYPGAAAELGVTAAPAVERAAGGQAQENLSK